MNLTSSNTDACGGTLEDSAGTHLIAAVCNLNGPFFLNLEVPIKITTGLGVQFDGIAGGTSKDNQCVIFYTQTDV